MNLEYFIIELNLAVVFVSLKKIIENFNWHIMAFITFEGLNENIESFLLP